jgi:flagellar biosynthetic protein FliQ
MEAMVLDLGRQAMITAVKLCGPVLLLGLVVGLIVSIFQAVTQLQEMTLTFVPKLIAVAIGLIIFGPWMLSTMTSFTTNVYRTLPNIPG